jgi:hypothetical protein
MISIRPTAVDWVRCASARGAWVMYRNTTQGDRATAQAQYSQLR